MSLEQFFPPTLVIIISAIFSIARFENQRWVRARMNGFRGANQAFGLFVDTTRSVALIFGLSFLVAAGWQFGWLTIGGLMLIGIVTTTLWALLSTPLFGGDNLFVWMVGTLAIWPLMVVLSLQLNWFGVI